MRKISVEYRDLDRVLAQRRARLADRPAVIVDVHCGTLATIRAGVHFQQAMKIVAATAIRKRRYDAREWRFSAAASRSRSQFSHQVDDACMQFESVSDCVISLFPSLRSVRRLIQRRPEAREAGRDQRMHGDREQDREADLCDE